MSAVTHHAQAGSLVLVVNGHTAGHLATAWRAYLTAMTVPPHPSWRQILDDLEAAQRSWVAAAAGVEMQGDMQPGGLQELLADAAADAGSPRGYSTRQVKDLLGVSRQRVDELRKSGVLPARRDGRGFIFVPRSVDELCARRRRAR